MFIRKTEKSSGGKKYYCYQLIESIRTERGPRQRIVLTLGARLSLEKEERKQLANRIEELLIGSQNFFALPEHIEKLAQEYAARLIKKQLTQPSPISKASSSEQKKSSDYQEIDVDSVEHEEGRQAGIESISYAMVKKLSLEKKFKELGLTQRQIQVAVGLIIHRLASPGSERFAHRWLQEISALDEIMGSSFQQLSSKIVYQAGDLLFAKKDEIEKFLEEQQETLFDCQDTIYLYDLTNTYFEGSAKLHRGAKHGFSKEKRSDCPLITLGLVINHEGFAKRSRIFEGNVGEAKTLVKIVEDLSFSKHHPILVMDAGLSSKENLIWLREKGIAYITVSREQKPIEIEENTEAFLNKSGHKIRVSLKKDSQTGEMELHCHSEMREEKEKAIEKKLRKSFENELETARSALRKKRGTIRYDKVLERIGRIKERHRKISGCYIVEVVRDPENNDLASAIHSEYLHARSRKKFEGGYILKSHEVSLNGEELWRVYIQLVQVEDSFKSLKSALGLRPIHHQKEKRIDAHLFITVLAYHVLHAIRYELRQQGINDSWDGIRRRMVSQVRVTTSMETKGGGVLRVRSTTKPTESQREIYRGLSLIFSSARVKSFN